jgi:hypothetical protein
MSSLWTPEGEYVVKRREPERSTESSGSPGQTSAEPEGGREHSMGTTQRSGEAEATGDTTRADEQAAPSEEDRRRLEELRRELAETPAAVVVANHAYGLFELAALHLSLRPPQLDQARLAIDAFGALVEGLEGRLAEREPELKEALAQIRLAFVRIASATSGPDGASAAKQAPG